MWRPGIYESRPLDQRPRGYSGQVPDSLRVACVQPIAVIGKAADLEETGALDRGHEPA
jgi:hypothetical protein